MRSLLITFGSLLVTVGTGWAAVRFFLGDPLLVPFALMVSARQVLAYFWLPIGIATLVWVGVMRTVPVARRYFSIATYIVLIMGVGTVWAYLIQRQDLGRLSPDRVVFNLPFYESLRIALSDPIWGEPHFIYPHSAAMKDCVGYAWSYRQKGFYPLPPNMAVDVLPAEWVAGCNTRRTE